MSVRKRGSDKSGEQPGNLPHESWGGWRRLGGLKAVTSSSGGQRDQHGDPRPIPHGGAAQGPAGGHAVPSPVSSRQHHHPLQDLLPRTAEPVRVPGKQTQRTHGPAPLPRHVFPRWGAFSLTALGANPGPSHGVGHPRASAHVP